MTDEAAQPAESPEARAARIIQNWRDGNAGEDDALDTARLVAKALAATTARPTERGAVEREEIARIIRTETDFDHPDQGHYLRAADRVIAALTPPVTVAATDQAGEVERRAIDFLATWYEWQGDPQPWWDALPPDRKEVAIRAALATQPATGRTMGGEAPSEDWLAEVLDDSLDMDWTGRVGAQAIIREWDRRYVD